MYATARKIRRSRRTTYAAYENKETTSMKRYAMFVIMAAFFATALAGCRKGG